MKNFDSDGLNVTLALTSIVAPNSPPKSGDACVAGRLVGIANQDGVVGGKLVITTRGVFNLAVKALHHTGITPGETVFIDPTTAVLSDDYTAVPFGVAIDPVVLAATTTIRVRLFGATPGATGANS